MGLHFEGEIVLIVEFDNAGVVDEGGAHPVTVYLFGCCLYVVAQQPLNLVEGEGLTAS